MFALVVLDLVFLVLSQVLGREECIQNDLFCVGWDVNLKSFNSVPFMRVAYNVCLCVNVQPRLSRHT